MAESFVAKKKRAGVMYRVLSKSYPDVKCELDFNNPLQLLIATVLSAQCTDKRVNSVTPALFFFAAMLSRIVVKIARIGTFFTR